MTDSVTQKAWAARASFYELLYPAAERQAALPQPWVKNHGRWAVLIWVTRDGSSLDLFFDGDTIGAYWESRDGESWRDPWVGRGRAIQLVHLRNLEMRQQ